MHVFVQDIVYEKWKEGIKIKVYLIPNIEAWYKCFNVILHKYAMIVLKLHFKMSPGTVSIIKKYIYFHNEGSNTHI